LPGGPENFRAATWKNDQHLGWQLYDERGRQSGKADAAQSAGNGVAGVLARNGDLILFR
jgi:hypothetical protein